MWIGGSLSLGKEKPSYKIIDCIGLGIKSWCTFSVSKFHSSVDNKLSSCVAQRHSTHACGMSFVVMYWNIFTIVACCILLCGVWEIRVKYDNGKICLIIFLLTQLLYFHIKLTRGSFALTYMYLHELIQVLCVCIYLSCDSWQGQMIPITLLYFRSGMWRSHFVTLIDTPTILTRICHFRLHVSRVPQAMRSRLMTSPPESASLLQKCSRG